MHGTPTAKREVGTAHSVAEILRKHVALEVEGIDRMYLNVYVPTLQAVEGVLKFIRIHRGHPVASTAMVEPITRRFVESIERYVHEHSIPMITFEKGQRKDDIPIGDHLAAGLPEACVIRMTRVTTLSDQQIDRRLGTITAGEQNAVQRLLKQYIP